MIDSIVILLTDIFFRLEKEEKDGYLILRLSVPLKILSDLYDRLTKVDVAPLETLPESEKRAYWNTALKFQPSDREKSILAYKACYVLKLITNS